MPFTWLTGISGGIGIAFASWGYRILKFSLFLCGGLVGMGAVCLGANVDPTEMPQTNLMWLGTAAAFVVMGMLSVAVRHYIGFPCVGLASGYLLLCLSTETIARFAPAAFDAFKPNYRISFIVILMAIPAALGLWKRIQRRLTILGTAFLGSYVGMSIPAALGIGTEFVIWGKDASFVLLCIHSGGVCNAAEFVDACTPAFPGKNGILAGPTSSWISLLCVFLVMFLASAILQFKRTAKHSNHLEEEERQEREVMIRRLLSADVVGEGDEEDEIRQPLLFPIPALPLIQGDAPPKYAEVSTPAEFDRKTSRAIDLSIRQLAKDRRAFLCPITQLVMKDPVFTSDGSTYERDAITRWLERSDTAPLTGLFLENKNLTPNMHLKGMIEQWKDRCRAIGVDPDMMCSDDEAGEEGEEGDAF